MENSENPLGVFLTNGFGDSYLYQVNRNAFNLSGSDSLYRSLLSEDLFNEYQLNVVIGTDSGIFPGYLAKHGVPAGSRYLFIELPSVIDALVAAGKLDDLPPEIVVVALESLSEQAEKFQISEYIFLDAVRTQESAASSDAHLPEYRELSWSVTQEIMKVRHRILTSTNTSQFTLRQLENLTENRVRFGETLKDAFAGRTAILLAGGPSLRKALPWVRKNRDKVLVIAVSRISRILQEEGVVPHIIVSVDPQRISFEVSREMLLYGAYPETPLFAHSYHASPLLVGQWPGKSVYFGQFLPWPSPLNTETFTYFGPTVSNSSVSLAMHMGCSAIVLAGVDLCFSAEGQTHAPGSNENKVGPDLSQLTPRVETYGGRWADTNQGYAESLLVLGQQAVLAADRGCRLYNCSLDAAKIELVDHRQLDELALGDDLESPSAVIDRLVPETTVAARLSHYRRIKKEVERARAKFQEILNLSREALQCTDGLFGRNGMQRDFRHKIRMDKIERRLDRGFKDFSALVKRFGLKSFLTILKTPKKAEEWTDEQIENATREYYQAYLDGTEFLIGLIDGTLERIAARMEEVKGAPNPARLFEQWEKDEQYGRLAAWRLANPEAVGRLSPAERDAAERIDREFARVLSAEVTSQTLLLERLHDLKHTRSKALILFRRKSIPELEAMAKGLSVHQDQEKAVPYLHFVEGLIAQLQDDPEQASAHYEHLLVDPPHPLTEDALLQIANISIAANDVAGALLAVECLTGISSTYLPPYGELLKVTGQFEDAFNAYNRYLGLVPDDVGAMVRLGMFCQEAGLTDAATELFDRALAKDPLNGAALTMRAAIVS